jgi:hypothetical protein
MLPDSINENSAYFARETMNRAICSFTRLVSFFFHAPKSTLSDELLSDINTSLAVISYHSFGMDGQIRTDSALSVSALSPGPPLHPYIFTGFRSDHGEPIKDSRMNSIHCDFILTAKPIIGEQFDIESLIGFEIVVAGAQNCPSDQDRLNSLNTF